jgi:hypothetical protein
MLIDKFEDRWLDQLNAQADRAADTSRTFLLIDGVFIPGFYRMINVALRLPDVVSLLFESLPACSEKTKSVSPFVAPYSSSNRELQNLLGQCSGWPMVSSVETTESHADLTARLEAWCVVEADKSNFNLRFPDTRRLGGIFEVLTAEQRLELCGPATRWSYIDRHGSWAELAVPRAPSAMADRPKLDRNQFSQLVSASDADEVVGILAIRGYGAQGRPSSVYSAVSVALRVAKLAGLDAASKVDWCEGCLAQGFSENQSEVEMRLAHWRASRNRPEERTLTKEFL